MFQDLLGLPCLELGHMELISQSDWVQSTILEIWSNSICGNDGRASNQYHWRIW